MKRLIFIVSLLTFMLCHGLTRADSLAVAENTAPQEETTSIELDVQAYPNPFTNEINIRCKNADIKRVEVWNVQKTMVFYSPIEILQGTEFVINTATYERGYYIVKVFTENAAKVILLSKREG